MRLRDEKRHIPGTRSECQRIKAMSGQEKSLPFFKTLKKYTKKSNFQWTAKAEMAFKKMKKSIAELPMLTSPKEKEELIIYIAATKEAFSTVLMTERDGKQMPSTSLVVHYKLGEHDIHYRTRNSVKGQILTDFIVKHPKDDSPDTQMEDEEEFLDSWILFTDGSSCIDGFGAGLILTNPKGVEFTYVMSKVIY
nr:reverse transcriptase domain-containing protein [Tanacetum cinerariifolium]